MRQDLQARINELCRKKGITKSGLAQALAVSPMDINRIGLRVDRKDIVLLHEITEYFHLEMDFWDEDTARPAAMERSEIVDFLDQLERKKRDALRAAEDMNDYVRCLQNEAQLGLLQYIRYCIREGL